MSTFDIEKFEDCARENGQRYWDAWQFMEMLGYENWNSFKSVIQKSMSNCLGLGIETEEIFVPITYEDGTKSYKLSRFACFLIAMQAYSKKPEVIKAQTALAALAEYLLEEKLSVEGIIRIEERNKLTDSEKYLGGIAKSAGILSNQFGIFKDAGFRGMYNMSLDKLKKYKGANSSKTLYDYMGITELAANTFRVTQTAERMKRNSVKGLHQSSATAAEVGKEVRDIMLRSSGTAPEDLPLEGDISSVKKQIKSTNKVMKQLDNKKISKKNKKE